VSQARRLFLTGERISAEEAMQVGMVHKVVPSKQLDAALKKEIENLLSSGSQAMAASKQIIAQHAVLDGVAFQKYVSERIADLRVGDEGQEGLQAFLEKRSPNWVTSNDS
jgi:methylglutaconyl-CoA hydratase